jgi:hypothetical protein
MLIHLAVPFRITSKKFLSLLSESAEICQRSFRAGAIGQSAGLGPVSSFSGRGGKRAGRVEFPQRVR